MKKIALSLTLALLAFAAPKAQAVTNTDDLFVGATIGYVVADIFYNMQDEDTAPLERSLVSFAWGAGLMLAKELITPVSASNTPINNDRALGGVAGALAGCRILYRWKF